MIFKVNSTETVRGIKSNYCNLLVVFTECQHKRALVCELINAAHKMVLLLPFMKPRSAIKHIEFVTIDRLDQINDKEQINICFDA